MVSPTIDFEDDERRLSAEDVENLDCRNAERRKQAQAEGAVLESETASYSPRYGYIFRYHVPHSVLGEDGKSYDVSHMMIWHTKDRKMYTIATRPYFRLIEPDSNERLV